MDPMDMSRQTSNSKLVSDGGSNQLQQTLTTITANTTGTNSSGDNVSTFSAGDRAKKSSGVLIQAGLNRHVLEIDDITTMASLNAKAASFLCGANPEVAANFPTLSNCLSVYRENFESLTPSSSVNNKSSSDLKKNSKTSQRSKNEAHQHSHDDRDKNVAFSLEKIKSIDQIKPNDTLHLVVHSYAFEQKNLIRSLVPHQLEVHSYKTFTYCDYCHDLLWGIMKQGVKCKLCKRNYHKRCANLLGCDCPGVPFENATPSLNSGSTSSGSTVNASGANSKRPRNLTQEELAHQQHLEAHGMANAFAHGQMAASPSALGMAGLGLVTPYANQMSDGGQLNTSKRPHSNTRDNGELFKVPKCVPGQVAANTKVPHSLVTHNLKQPVSCYVCTKSIKQKQSLQCTDCKINVCPKEKCVEALPKNCPGQAEDMQYYQNSNMDNPNQYQYASAAQIQMEDTNNLNLYVGGMHTNRRSSNNVNMSFEINSSHANKFKYDENASDDDDDDPSQSLSNMQLDNPQSQDGMDVSADKVREGSLTAGGSSNVPLQRLVNSVRRCPRGPPSLKGNQQFTLLSQGWLVHYTSLSERRMRHYWRLTTRAVILYSDDCVSNNNNYAKTYKTIQLHDIQNIEEGYDRNSNTPLLRLIMQTVVYNIMEDTSTTHESKPISNWVNAFKTALAPHLTNLDGGGTAAASNGSSGGSMHPPSNPRGSSSDGSKQLTKQNSWHWSRHQGDQDAKNLEDIYQIQADEILGSGQFGVVYSAKHRSRPLEVAIKCIDKKRFPQKQDKQLRHEVTVLSGLDHPGIVKIYNMFENPTHVYVVMEKLNGDMLELILNSEEGRLNEKLAKFLVHQILIALGYLHKRCIVHCDLKPENVLILATGDNYPRIKLCDFGFARIIGEKSFRSSVVGTPAYLAPEVLRNEGYNRSLDMWSVGVIIYVTLSGTFPFNEDEDINDQIENAEFMFPAQHWANTTVHAIELIKALLQVQRRKRLSVDKAISQVWLQDYQLWCDLRTTEKKYGQRYLTHESDDDRWEAYAKRHNKVLPGAVTAKPPQAPR